ncbi:calmodulin-like protein 4 isoform X3 [Pyrgilauda ruficollis]|uniref:calmodulin-like protein 4 isoform X3 n=1 Tax=Pyrgilauda ruficollis TaxID=221976 RepID=UPI001B86B755|nr:calmodulin-like protein 4 isoform X3 [Pyrgilauda ruficollis]
MAAGFIPASARPRGLWPRVKRRVAAAAGPGAQGVSPKMKQKGKIKASDLLAVMRCLGASPTPGEVQRHLQLHRIDRNAELDFSTFLNIMYRQMKQEEPEEEILRALAMIDRQKRGVIAAPELRAKLTRLGEKLSDEEVDDLLREAKVGPNGTIKYEEFVHHICLPSVDY